MSVFFTSFRGLAIAVSFTSARLLPLFTGTTLPSGSTSPS